MRGTGLDGITRDDISGAHEPQALGPTQLEYSFSRVAKLRLEPSRRGNRRISVTRHDIRTGADNMSTMLRTAIALTLSYAFATSSASSTKGTPPAEAAFRAEVRIGYCGRLKDVAAAKAAGFDYIELGTSEIAALSDDAFEKSVNDIKSAGLPVPVTNLFLPADLKVTGPQIDREQQMAYVRKAFARLSRLGTEIVVFGSGGARRVPEGFDKGEAFKQLVDFGQRIAPEARARGITIAIEPLRRQETNIINSAAEGLELVKAVGDANFQLMIDFYHLASEQEDPAVVLRAKEHLRHLHTANPQGRVFPQKWDEFDYAPFFANLRQIGYDKRISVEASTKDLPGEAPQAIALLRRAFEGALRF
jgi:D-psicose/D-tagatose/L-ribulose 3-epimerase